MSFTFDNYSELQAALASYLHRSNLSDEIPGFIKLAEAEMNRYLRPWRLESVSSLSITGGGDTVALPSRIREVKSVLLTGSEERELIKMSVAQLNDLYSNKDADTPRHYALSGSNIILGPTPTESGTLDVLCIRAPAPLTDVDNTNVILQEYPDIYLYGAAKHGFLYLRNTQRAMETNQTFMTGIEEANRESRKLKASGIPDGRRHIGRARIV